MKIRQTIFAGCFPNLRFRLLIIIILFAVDGGTLYTNPAFSIDLISAAQPEMNQSLDHADISGWNADPDVVKDHEKNRPQYLWRESKVPDYTLPDPLRASNGVIAGSEKQWENRRREILDIFREDVYGHRPGPPDKLTFELVEEDISAMQGAATLKRIRIHSTREERTHQFELVLFLPNHRNTPAPLFLLMNNRGTDNTDPNRLEKSGFWPAEEVIERGYGIAAIHNPQLAPDDTAKYHEGVIRLFEGETDARERPKNAWAAISGWGWGASRAMDYFETDSRIDCSKVAVLGHSRGGKASLWAGAEDQRFSLVISNNSGCGGAALSKRRYGETIEAVNRFTHWFAPNFRRFNGREDDLHFDQHMLISLIAPRAVYIASADADLWADPRGEFLSLVHASPVYGIWDYPSIEADDIPALNESLVCGPRGYHVRSGSHNLTPWDWHLFMDFADGLWKK
jgi:hypothetical protein